MVEKNTVRIRFYEELNDFLPLHMRKVWIEYCLDSSMQVRDLISCLGVDPVYVDLVLVDGESVDFSYRVKNGDRISIYPVFESFDISGVTRLRSRPLRELRFILDSHLGQLAHRLQVLGFDVIRQPDDRQDLIIKIAEKSNRILLTRNQALLEGSAITRSYLVRAVEPEDQVAEVMLRFDLSKARNRPRSLPRR
ncbi:MAG: Mut7-C RNAse domain-containing protein [bacterium]